MLLEILRRTPLWVWPLFLLLLAFGAAQSRTRNVGGTRVAALPAAMIGLSLFGAWSAFGASLLAGGAWLAGALAALAGNGVARWPRGVAYSAETRSFLVPGSWVPLVLMMGIFFARYAVAAGIAIEPRLAAAASFVAAASFAYGLLSGAFLARALRIQRAAAVPHALRRESESPRSP